MDPLTHAISGAALARALPSKPLPTRQVWLLIILTMAPDADYLLKLFSDTLYLQHHRGLTHSLLMLPLWVWLAHTLFRPSRYALSPWLIAAALALHITLDLITSFGTMILAPFTDWRATLDLIFIIDPLFTACLLLPLLCGIGLRQARRALAIASLALTATYLSLALWAHGKAIEITQETNPDATAIAALPMPFSPFYWQLIASYSDHYKRTAINILPGFSGTAPLFPAPIVKRYAGDRINDRNHLQWQQLPAMSSLALPSNLPGVSFYRWFARFPVVLSRSPDHIELGDLRFGAGSSGVKSAFRLMIDLKPAPAARLIWRGTRSSPLTGTRPPFDWLQHTRP